MMPGKHKSDRDHKKKRKKRSVSRSRSRSRSPQERGKRRRDDRDSPPRTSNAAPNTGTSGGGDVSLSIEETNKLRAQLGMAPLEVDDKPEEGGDESGKKQFVHAPAKSLSEARRSDQQRERLAVGREKRRLQDRLAKVKGLGESSDEEEGAGAWVSKSRGLEKAREEARKRAQQLQSMDEEFEERGPTYDTANLGGLKVEHDVSRFKEGKTIILTLKDRGVLDEEEEEGKDVLVNVNIQDDERADKNVENKKGGPDYKPYDDAEVLDEDSGLLRHRDILEKYDAEITGESKRSFQLGVDGRYNAEHERALERLRAENRDQEQSLTTNEPSLAKDYFTAEEMAAKAKFRKRKRRAKAVRAQALTADDLLITAEEDVNQDHGNRRRRGEKPANAPAPAAKEETEEVPAPVPMEEDVDLYSGPVEEDVAADELEDELKKVRALRTRHCDGRRRQEMLESMLETAAAGGAVEAEEGTGTEVVMHDIAEFCRTLGDLPSLGLVPGGPATTTAPPSAIIDEAEAAEVEEEWRVERQRRAAAERVAGGWQEVMPAGFEEEGEVEAETPATSSRSHMERIKQSSNAVLEEEPQLATGGVAAALNLASQKGYLQTESKKQAPDTRVFELRAQHYVQEQVRYDDIEAKFSKRDRFAAGPVSEFREKSTYQPCVKLDYVDESGRSLNAKEAFRELSHRFHGKGSGKKKTEKKQKRIKEEFLLKAMSSSDTPLGTVDKLHRKLETQGLPYVVLSGKNATASSLTK